MIEEIWKDISDWEGLYQVSNLGRIKSLPRTVYHPGDGNRNGFYINLKERILKPILIGEEYLSVSLCRDGIHIIYMIHRLVAETFIGEIPEGMEVHHKDENKLKNELENLEIVTCSVNIQKSRDNNKVKPHRRCKYKLINVETNEEIIFNSAAELGRFVGKSDVSIKKYAYKIWKGLLDGKYEIEPIQNLN